MNPRTRHSGKNIRYTEALLRPLAQSKLSAMQLEGPAPSLRSTFALDQLSEVARRTGAPQFALLMAPIFGFDIPARAYLKLQDALLLGQIKNPEHRISHDVTHPADYDNNERIIRIHPLAFEELLQTPERGWELLAILLHEFGHHVDNLLRVDFTDDTLPIPDAPRDEGSRYARAMALSKATHNGAVSIARYTLADADEAAIVVEYSDAMQAVARFQGGDGTGEAIGQREPFEASGSVGLKPGQFSHETIEKQLQGLGFNEQERQAVYFGNWLRDYSQLLDPKLVRAADMPKSFPNTLSRQALTRIVDVLAVRKFSDLRQLAPEHFTVTEEKLGVYLPSEHIDNPKVTNPDPQDPKTRDADFEPWVLPGAALLEVDYERSMKRYIQRSVDRMQRDLRATMNEGRNARGLQKLGSALHVLEDFFAHSNFAELSLIKLGYKVLPWTAKTDCKWELPLVTGTFSGLDIIASLALPVAKILAPVEPVDLSPSVAGERSDNEQMMLILLGEHHQETLLATYKDYLAVRDVWRKIPAAELLSFYTKLKLFPLQVLQNAYNAIFQGIFKMVGNSVDDIQTLLGSDPHTTGSTDPSHSQLAKDHAEHPFHQLAADLARAAVQDVAKAMLDYWNGVPGVDPANVAGGYFTHPHDSEWQDDIVTKWAIQNPINLKRGASKTELDTLHLQMQESTAEAFKTLHRESQSAWEKTVKFIEELLNLRPAWMDKEPKSVLKEIGSGLIKGY